MSKSNLNFIFLGILFFSSCKPESFDDLDTSISEDEIQIRSSDSTCLAGVDAAENSLITDCYPGEYFIDNGILTFINNDEFIKTIDFLGCADNDLKESWLANIPIETPYKKYNQVLSLLCDDLETDEVETLLNQHSSDILYSWDDESEIIIYPLYSTYPYFRNMGGYFKIGNKIDVQINNNRLVVFNGGFPKLHEILTETNSLQDSIFNNIDTSFVIIRSPYCGTAECCPNTNKENFFYGPDNRRRLTSEYTWTDASEPLSRFIWLPVLDFQMSAELRKRNDFGRWSKHRRHFRFNTKIDWWVVPTKKTEKENVSYIVSNNAWTHIVAGSVPGSPFRSDPIGLAGSQENCQIVCVSAVEHTVYIYEDLDQSPEQTFTMTCEQKDPRLCRICPDGWEWDADNEACSIGTCAPNTNTFIWNGGMYYHYINGVQGNCSAGGVDNGAACYLGHLPSGWHEEGLIIDDCFYAEGRCP